MHAVTLAVVNRASVCKDADLLRYCRALQVQVSRDFAPAWDLDAQIVFVGRGMPAPKAAWPCFILDDADQPGALGYHDEDPGAPPFGHVFAKTTMQAGEQVSVTLSHEILEMLGDPHVNLSVLIERPEGFRLYAYETADAVEAGAYPIGGVPVSNFVYPAWFDPLARAGNRFDFLHQLSQPFQLARGGYSSVYDGGQGAGWQQVQAEHAPAVAHRLAAVPRDQPYSRHARRAAAQKRRP